MTPAQIYAMPQVQRHRLGIENFWGCYYTHVPEIENGDLDYSKLDKITRITTVVHAFYAVDYRRYWAIWSAWLDGKPYMLMQNAGREGDDYRERYITDNNLYNEALQLLRTCFHDSAITANHVVWDINKDVPEIEDFYGTTIQEALAQNPPMETK